MSLLYDALKWVKPHAERAWDGVHKRWMYAKATPDERHAMRRLECELHERNRRVKHAIVRWERMDYAERCGWVGGISVAMRNGDVMRDWEQLSDQSRLALTKLEV